MNRFNHGLGVLVTALGFALTTPALAQHADIELELNPGNDPLGVITPDPHNEALSASALKPGRKIFEAEFGEFGNPFGTDDPGFDAEDGSGFIPGSILGLRALDGLWKWDGATWQSGGFLEQIDISDVMANTVTVGAGTGTGVEALIDQFDAGGGLHSHVDFDINVAGGGTPQDGAYAIEFEFFGVAANLTDPLYTDSDPFLVLFHLNEGGTFGELAFEAAVDAFAPVPLPPAVFLFGSAAALAGLRRRRNVSA